MNHDPDRGVVVLAPSDHGLLSLEDGELTVAGGEGDEDSEEGEAAHALPHRNIGASGEARKILKSLKPVAGAVTRRSGQESPATTTEPVLPRGSPAAKD